MAGQKEWRRLFLEWLQENFALSRLTQVELADRVGVSQAQVSKYLVGKDLPDDDIIERMAIAFGAPAPQMLFYPEPSIRRYAGAAESGPGGSRVDGELSSDHAELLAIFDALGAQARRELLTAARLLAP